MQTIEEYKELYKAKLKARRDARAELVREEEYLRKLYAYERKKEEQATYEEERREKS